MTHDTSFLQKKCVLSSSLSFLSFYVFDTLTFSKWQVCASREGACRIPFWSCPRRKFALPCEGGAPRTRAERGSGQLDCCKGEDAGVCVFLWVFFYIPFYLYYIYWCRCINTQVMYQSDFGPTFLDIFYKINIISIYSLSLYRRQGHFIILFYYKYKNKEISLTLQFKLVIKSPMLCDLI